jgi:hypothetical protein
VRRAPGRRLHERDPVAVRHLAQARSAREPGVVFIDDLHWVDPGSEAFVAQLVEVAATTRTLVLVNFRPEYRADWMQQSHYLSSAGLVSAAIAAARASYAGEPTFRLQRPFRPGAR